MTDEQRILIDLVKYALGSHKTPDYLSALSVKEKKKIMVYAGKQGLFPFLQYYPAFLEGELHAQTFQYLAQACYADAIQLAEVESVLNEFEKRGIYCIPLKGICTKQLYPTSELRSMGDLDILYKPEQTKDLKSVMEMLGFHSEGEAAKHDHYQKGNTVVEMHKTLLSAQSTAFNYFLGVWERAVPKEGKQFVYEMTMEDHYLFTLYHLIEHFIRGGIGIRMVLDIYILSERKDIDWEYVEGETEKLRIDIFERKIRTLSRQWFSEEVPECEEDLSELEEYIVNGGIFGNQENDRQNNMLMHGSKSAYLRSVVFPSYQTMRTVFPWLRTPLLLPVAWAVRAKNVWTKRRGNIRMQMERAKAWEGKDVKESEKRKQFFERCGL